MIIMLTDDVAMGIKPQESKSQQVHAHASHISSSKEKNIFNAQGLINNNLEERQKLHTAAGSRST